MVSSIRRALGPLDARPQIPLTPDGLNDGRGAAEPRTDESATDHELARLERSLQNIQRECAIAVLEASPRPRQALRRLPPAAQLGPIEGIPSAQPEPLPPHRERRGPLPLRPPPPLVAERRGLPPARRQRSARLRGALYVLIASLVAGSIAYQVLSGGVVSATDAAHAALSAVTGIN
jgi:hypothetical protein